MTGGAKGHEVGGGRKNGGRKTRRDGGDVSSRFYEGAAQAK